MGTVGRESGLVRIEVKHRARKLDLEPQVDAFTRPGSTCNTDEWKGYNGVAAMGRTHRTVRHAEREYARDDDGDGIREVHINTIEGIWTGLRNFLRIFRGVNKKYLHLYTAIFEIAYNHKLVSPDVVQAACFRNRILTT